MTPAKKSSRATVTLKRGKARPVWSGHPWIYSGAIHRVDGDVEPGGLVSVLDDQRQSLGVGTFHPQARIAVRMLAPELPDGGLESLIRQRIAHAVERRARLGLPNERTTAYRLINGEGDGLPGVICDQLGDLASVQITTLAAEAWLPILMDALAAPIVAVRIPPDSARMEPGLAPGERFGRGDHEEHIDLLENGLRWRLKPGHGQKTGFYTDQRDNRQRVANLAGGRRVLDAFCYTGGFGLNAARAGATTVVGVDSSGPAISVAAGTAELNGLAGTRFLKEDVVRYLKGLDADERFDLVIMDPPKLAKGMKSLDDAYKKYRAINQQGIERVAPRGFFVSCSCSGLVGETMFLRMLTDAAYRAGRRLFVHEIHSAAADHVTPVALAEARYLTVVIASLDD